MILAKSYYLRNKDNIIASFDLVHVGTEFEYYYIADNTIIYNNAVYANAIGYMELIDFLEIRKAPLHRAYIKEMFRYLNFADITNYLDVTYGFSLIDTLWIRPKDSDIVWKEINLFDNKFSDVIAHYAFSGTGLYGKQIKDTSPEFSTDGCLPKCWIRKNNKVFLKKGSTAYLQYRNAGFEPYAEYYAFQIADQMQLLPYVEYDLGIQDNLVYCLCPLFTSVNVGYFSMSQLMSIHGVDSQGGHLKLLKDYGFL